MKKRCAILIDGAFFLKRYKNLGKIKELDAEKTVKYLHTMCLKHLKQKTEVFDLYRIFYYDCLPYGKKQHNPITKKSIDFTKTEQYKFKEEFLKRLKAKRKVAI